MAASSPSVPETKINGMPGEIFRAIFSADRPSNEGSVKSDRIRSKIPWSIKAEKPSCVATWETATANPSDSSKARISSASLELSSRWRIRKGRFRATSPGRTISKTRGLWLLVADSVLFITQALAFSGRNIGGRKRGHETRKKLYKHTETTQKKHPQYPQRGPHNPRALSRRTTQHERGSR